MSRVEGMPVYEQQTVEVPAKLYNLWRRAKLHFAFPMQFSLECYRGLVMILDENEWLCADERQNDMPVICWIEFMDQGRDAIHLPVTCTLNYYHFAAHTIRETVLDLMEQELNKLLNKHNNIKGD